MINPTAEQIEARLLRRLCDAAHEFIDSGTAESTERTRLDFDRCVVAVNDLALRRHVTLDTLSMLFRGDT